MKPDTVFNANTFLALLWGNSPLKPINGTAYAISDNLAGALNWTQPVWELPTGHVGAQLIRNHYDTR